MKELYVSVDVEADGPIPGEYSMTSLGAYVAGYKDETGYHRLSYEDDKNKFYTEIKPISENFILDAMKVAVYENFNREQVDADEDGSKIREYLNTNGEEAHIAMGKFVDWLESLQEEHPNAALVFAGFPVGFDWMFTYWYLVKFSKGSVFGHSRHLDIKTLYFEKSKTFVTRSVKSRMKKSLRPKMEHTHKAIDDAVEQGVLLMNILEWEPNKTG